MHSLEPRGEEQNASNKRSNLHTYRYDEAASSSYVTIRTIKVCHDNSFPHYYLSSITHLHPGDSLKIFHKKYLLHAIKDEQYCSGYTSRVASATPIRRKQGHSCCGGCCDVRRAVVVLCILSIVGNFIGLCSSQAIKTFVDGAATSFSFDDDSIN